MTDQCFKWPNPIIPPFCVAIHVSTAWVAPCHGHIKPRNIRVARSPEKLQTSICFCIAESLAFEVQDQLFILKSKGTQYVVPESNYASYIYTHTKHTGCGKSNVAEDPKRL